jgi:hypothetical protein
MIHKIRELAFGFFYVLTERTIQTGNESRLGTMYWSLLYLFDAGQVISAMTLPAYGWHPEVLLYLDKLDVFKTIFKSVYQTQSYRGFGECFLTVAFCSQLCPVVLFGCCS